MKSIGSSGLKRTGGLIYEEFLPRLQGILAIRVFSEMSNNSSVIGGILYAIKSLIRQCEWRVEPTSEDEKAREEALFVEGAIHDMSISWDDFLCEVLTMLVYGWCFHEIVYKRRNGSNKKSSLSSKYTDGRIGWQKFGIRAQDTLDHWEFDDDGDLLGLVQHDYYSDRGPVFIPIEKALLFRIDPTKGNPEGRSVLRTAVRDWWFLKRIQEIEAIGIERDLAGLPDMQVPIGMLKSDASTTQKTLLDDLKKMMQEVKRDERECVIRPSEVDTNGNPTGYKFGLVSTGGSRQIDTNAIITRYEQRIAMSVLMEYMLLGMQEVGSRSLADSKTHISSLAHGAIMDSIAGIFNTFAIPRLMRLNGVSSEYWPTLEHGDIESPDLTALGGFLTSMASAGVLGSGTALERELLSMAKLSLPEEDLEMAKSCHDSHYFDICK
jgi:hypothetical protein